jgi:hypothetical protein
VRTGRRITQIPVLNGPWSTGHKTTGEVSIDIPLRAAEFRMLEQRWLGGKYPNSALFPGPATFPEQATPLWRLGQGIRPELLAAVEPARCFLAVLEGDTVLEAGPIWWHDYNDDRGVLTVRAGSMRSIFDHRAVIGLLASWPGGKPARWQVTYGGLSLGTIAKRLVAQAQAFTGGALPIDFQDDEAGEHERTYKGNEIATVLSRLDQLSGVQDGPDISFDPYLTPDRQGVRWNMRTGTNADPLLHQAGDDHVWDAIVPRGGLSGISVRRDATKVASRAWETGAGIDEALLMAYATDPTLTDRGWPLLESIDQRSTVEEQRTLDAWARGDLAAAARPWQTWSFRARADQSPRLGTYRPGDFSRVWVPKNHPYLGLTLGGGQHYRARIMTVRGNVDEFVDVTCMPTMEAR